MRFRDRKSCVLSQKMHGLCQNFVIKVVSFSYQRFPGTARSYLLLLPDTFSRSVHNHQSPIVYERRPWWPNNIVVCRDWVRRKKWKYEKAPILSSAHLAHRWLQENDESQCHLCCCQEDSSRPPPRPPRPPPRSRGAAAAWRWAGGPRRAPPLRPSPELVPVWCWPGSNLEHLGLRWWQRVHQSGLDTTSTKLHQSAGENPQNLIAPLSASSCTPPTNSSPMSLANFFRHYFLSAKKTSFVHYCNMIAIFLCVIKIKTSVILISS